MVVVVVGAGVELDVVVVVVVVLAGGGGGVACGAASTCTRVPPSVDEYQVPICLPAEFTATASTYTSSPVDLARVGVHADDAADRSVYW